jgi:hypothetical protein
MNIDWCFWIQNIGAVIIMILGSSVSASILTAYFNNRLHGKQVRWEKNRWLYTEISRICGELINQLSMARPPTLISPNEEIYWPTKDFNGRAQSIVPALGNLSTLISYSAILGIDTNKLRKRGECLRDEFQQVQDEESIPKENLNWQNFGIKGKDAEDGFKNAHDLKEALDSVLLATEECRDEAIKKLETERNFCDWFCRR